MSPRYVVFPTRLAVCIGDMKPWLVSLASILTHIALSFSSAVCVVGVDQSASTAVDSSMVDAAADEAKQIMAAASNMEGIIYGPADQHSFVTDATG